MNAYEIGKIIVATRVDRNNTLCQNDVKKVLSMSFNVNKELNKLISQLYVELGKSNSIYWENVRYYKMYGGLYPENNSSSIEKLINDVKHLKSIILNEVNNIKEQNNWKYRTSFRTYLEELYSLF